jgi:serine protease Do
MIDPNEYRNHSTEGSNSNENTKPSEQNNTVWQGDCYHSYRSPGSPTPDYSYGLPRQSYVPVLPEKPKKKRHLFPKILAGILSCMVISAGSIAGFAALVNNGTIQMNTSGTTPAFTIVKNSSSTNATNTSTGSNLTNQAIAKKVIPSVVCIENYQNTAKNRNTGYSFGFGSNEEENSNGEVSPASEGSGIIATSDGYIITNAHVVSEATALKVILSDGTKYEATLVGSDSVTDLAVVKIKATGLTAAEFGSSSQLLVGDSVLAVGSPGGEQFSSTVTSGIVSALDREITNSETGYTMNCIQTDTAINPGNSGGPLVNSKGQVVGINSSKISATGYEGLGFSIPIDEAQTIISQLKQYGYVKDRAVLGITGKYVDSISAQLYGVASGMYVYSISSNYVSAAGIQKGDVITKIDDKEVTSQSTLTSEIATKKPGDTVTLSVTRSLTGQTFTAKVKLSQATGK